MRINKRDLFFSVTSGFIAGFIAWRLLLFLQVDSPLSVSYAWLMIALPALWLLGTQIGYWLAVFHPSFREFGKFVAIGLTNTLVDFGYLNILIGSTGHDSGIWFSFFKGASFIVANISGYIFNRFWTFSHVAVGKHKEYGKYFVVSVAALIINVMAASIVVNIVGPSFGIDSTTWATVGATIGSASALLVNFVGYKKVVFKSE